MNSTAFISTQFFLFPIFYAYRLKQYTLLFSYLLAYTASMSYHINDQYGSIFYLLDLFSSRLSTIINFSYSFNKLPFHYNFLLLNNLTVTYLYSCFLYQLNHEYAVVSYIYFHFWVSLSAILLSYNISLL